MSSRFEFVLLIIVFSAWANQCWLDPLKAPAWDIRDQLEDLKKLTTVDNVHTVLGPLKNTYVLVFDSGSNQNQDVRAIHFTED